MGISTGLLYSCRRLARDGERSLVPEKTPTAEFAGVILMQLIPFADAKSLALLDDFERAVYASLS